MSDDELGEVDYGVEALLQCMQGDDDDDDPTQGCSVPQPEPVRCSS